MAGYVVSDYTLMAIAEGMKRNGFITKRKNDFTDMLDALWYVNVAQVQKTYSLPLDYEPEGFVGLDKLRDYSDAEVVRACSCWLDQVEKGAMSFDYITLTATVHLLKDTIIERNLEDGTWKRRCYFGTDHYLERDEGGQWLDIAKIVGEWNLAA